ncbi:MAG: class I SAM-dependent methyltransferase [Candidatus Izemoplasmatales bacterium]|nr:class I SAM-dependent methyltransferase [Candidatus Izemoplasmatales bacterium]
MNKDIEIVKQYYDEFAEKEWLRLSGVSFEFEITLRMMKRYIKPGDSVLDLGGGPGRYSIALAQMGCDVTLVDLSDGNIEVARREAKNAGVKIHSMTGNVLELETLPLTEYDHVLLMGPLYHLLEEEDRIQAVHASLHYLKPKGFLFVSFIQLFAGLIYYMQYAPDALLQEPDLQEYLEDLYQDKPYTGNAFTKACFLPQKKIVPFMSQFGLQQVTLFGQESILAPQKPAMMKMSEEAISLWLDVAERLCEREEFLSYAEHAIFIGRK